MFGRPARTKISNINDCVTYTDDGEVRYKNAVSKMKGKLYTDRKRKASLFNTEIGGVVLIKNMETKGKLATFYRPEKFKIIGRRGDECKLMSLISGKTIRRHVSHLNQVCDSDDRESTVEEIESNSSVMGNSELDNRNKDAPIPKLRIKIKPNPECPEIHLLKKKGKM